MGCARRGLTIVEVLIVGALVVTLVGLLIPAVLRIRAAAERSHCSDNLRRLGMALHAYHDGYNSFPIACDMNPSVFGYSPKGNFGRQKYWMLSWSTRILPYLEQDNLYRQMDIAQDDMQVATPDRYFPFDNNRFVALGVSLPVFHCPSDSRSFQAETLQGLRVGCTSYLGVSGITTMGSQLGLAAGRESDRHSTTGVRSGDGPADRLQRRAHSQSQYAQSRSTRRSDCGDQAGIGQYPDGRRKTAEPGSCIRVDVCRVWQYRSRRCRGSPGYLRTSNELRQPDEGICVREVRRRRCAQPQRLEIRARFAHELLRCASFLEPACGRRPFRHGRWIRTVLQLRHVPDTATRHGHANWTRNRPRRTAA